MTSTRSDVSTRAKDITGGYGHRVRLPVVGEVAVPPPDKVAYYAGVGVLAALQVIEWPIALVLTVGHVLADQHMSRFARGLGEAAESA
jgi:hypothetical protein